MWKTAGSGLLKQLISFLLNNSDCMQIDVTGGITEVTARRNVELPLKSTFLQADKTAADITGFNVSAVISDGLSDSEASALLFTLTDEPDEKGNYFIREHRRRFELKSDCVDDCQRGFDLSEF